MLKKTKKEVGHMTLKKCSFLYKFFRAYHNFCTQQQLFKYESSNFPHNDEWIPNWNIAKESFFIALNVDNYIIINDKGVIDMPCIRPVSDLRNHFAHISKGIHETNEPIF